MEVSSFLIAVADDYEGALREADRLRQELARLEEIVRGHVEQEHRRLPIPRRTTLRQVHELDLGAIGGFKPLVIDRWRQGPRPTWHARGFESIWANPGACCRYNRDSP